MMTRVRSLSLDRRTHPAEADCEKAADRLWWAFCTASKLSCSLSSVHWLWTAARQHSDLIVHFLGGDGVPSVESRIVERTCNKLVDVERTTTISHRAMRFDVISARRGVPCEDRGTPPWTLVSASVDFGPAGSLDRAWAVLELFAGWEPEVASGWEMDEIADALSEVPELSVAFVHDDGESGPSLSYAERLLLDHLLAPVRAELQQTEGQSLMVDCRDKVELALDAVWRALPFAEIEARGIEIPDRHLRAADPARLCSEILDIGRAMGAAERESNDKE